jgi:hypothetical protein
MKIIIDNVDYVGRNWITDTKVEEFENCLAIAQRKPREDYQQIDKEADVVEILTNIPKSLIDEIPVQQLHELFLKLTTEVDKDEMQVVNEWEGYVTKGFESYNDIMANRGEFRNFEKHLKKKSKRYISHIVATFFKVPDNDYTYHYAKKLDLIKQMPTKVAMPYVLKAFEIIGQTTKTAVDAERQEVQETPQV